jgi:DNA polymerase III epsilon subunit-like protein
MMFAKDILLIDVETTHLNPDLADPIQISALLLDKNTLQEKDAFMSYIYSDLANANPASLAVSGINVTGLKDAPKQPIVGKQLVERFGFNIMLASWVEHLDRRMFHKLVKAAGFETINYDYHYLDLWPIAYAHLLKQGYSGDIKSEEMFQALGMPPRQKHDALQDCRYEAEILRKIMS